MLARVDPFLRALLVAGVAHGTVIASVQRSVAPDAQPTAAVEPGAAAAELVDIDVLLAETVSDPSPTESTVTISGPVPPSRHGSRPAFRRHAQPAQDRSEPVDLTGSADDAAVRAASATDAVAEKPSLSLDQLGLEGPNRLSLRTIKRENPPATERAASPERFVQSMRQLAQEHDRKAGLGAAGPVAMALETAAYQSNVPLDGQATFEVVVMGDVVSAVSLAPSDAKPESAWNEVAKTALAQLAGRRVRVPTGRRGIVLRIQVASRAALPSGHDPGVEVTVGPFVVQRGSGPRSARLAFLDSIGLTSLIDLPGTAARLPSAGAVVSLVRTDIDPVDLGAKDRQVVHTSTLDETPLD